MIVLCGERRRTLVMMDSVKRDVGEEDVVGVMIDCVLCDDGVYIE